MSKYIELAKKLKALADRGIGGEKINAEKMLKALMKKHGITMQEIEGDEIDFNEIIVSKEKKKLFHQIGYSIFGKAFRNLDIRRVGSTRYVKCTKAQAVEWEAKLNFYWRLYAEELDIFFHAFVQRNNIFSSDAEEHEPKPEERERIRRVLEMASTIKKESYSKLLK